MSNKIVFDLETQKNFTEAGGRNRHHDLRVSVAVAYSYDDNQYHVFEEPQIHKLGEMLQTADQVIGFNIKHFDFEVLQPYLNFSVETVPSLDILEYIERSLGHRISLEAVAQATLGVGKSGTGLAAIGLWKSGRIDELKKYCIQDVEITRKIYEYGAVNGKLLYQDFFEVREIPVSFPQAVSRSNVQLQKSLF